MSKKDKAEKTKIKDYLLASKRILKAYWVMDKFNLVSRLIIATLQVSGTVLATYIGGQVLGKLVESIQSGYAVGGVYRLAIIEVAVLLTVDILSSLDDLLIRIVWIKWDKYFTLTFNEKRASLDIDFFEDRTNQKLINKVADKGGWVLGNLAEQIIYVFYNILKIILIIGSVLKLGIWPLLLLTIASVPRIYARFKRSKLQWTVWHTRGDEFHRHWKTLNLFSEAKNLIEIKLYGLKRRLLYDVAGKNLDKFNTEQIGAAKSTLNIEVLANSTYNISFLIVTLSLIQKAISGVITIANFGFFSGILGQFSSSLGNLSSIISNSGENALYARDFFKVLDQQSYTSSPTENATKLNKTEIPTIEFKNVSFAYRSNPKEKILDNLNLTINPGEHLALVGENGAGKTTIIKLLLRLYDVTEGEILVNGINIKQLDLNSYWRQIGVLFQDFNRYPFDIQTNIELGRVNKKPTKKDLDRAVELANLKPILKKLPKGINTILDNSFEEGVEPSGGQWQRVVLARAFYRNSNILILDEPTAAVDANAEYEIFNNIFAHYGDKTALIISHRFSTVKRAQRIVVLEKGQIIEQGSHLELMKNSKLYADMFNKQAEGYQT